MNNQKPRTAVSLEYSSTEEAAPTVSAIGTAEMAEKILTLARRYGVPIVENRPLVQTLKDLELDQEIPPELYKAVALVLAQLEEGDVQKAASLPKVKQ